jgi:hypothetical protein
LAGGLGLCFFCLAFRAALRGFRPRLVFTGRQAGSVEHALETRSIGKRKRWNASPAAAATAATWLLRLP